MLHGRFIHFISIVFCLTCAAVTANNECPSKQSSVDCFFSKGDFDNDGLLSKSDLDSVAANYLPWYLRIPFAVFGGSDQVLTDCDLNADGHITREEALTSGTCLETCEKRLQVVQLMCY